MFGTINKNLIKHLDKMDLDLHLSPTEEETILRMCYYKGADNRSQSYVYQGSIPYYTSISKQNEISLNQSREKYKEIITPDLVSNNGWLIYKHIESIEKEGSIKVNCPYRVNKRSELFKEGLEKKGVVQLDWFEYISKKNYPRSERVYRIKRTTEVFLKLFMYFTKEGSSNTWKFLKSDYYKESYNIFDELFVVNMYPAKSKDDYVARYKARTKVYWYVGHFRAYSKIVPPSLIRWLIKEKTWPIVDQGEYKLTIRRLFVTFVIFDYIQCTDSELKKEFSNLLKGIDDHDAGIPAPKKSIQATKYAKFPGFIIPGRTALSLEDNSKNQVKSSKGANRKKQRGGLVPKK